MLIPVTDYTQEARAGNGLLLQSGATNGIPDREKLEREIRQGTLFLAEAPCGLLLLRRRQHRDILNFLLKKGERLHGWKPERPTISELPFRREGEPMEEVAQDMEALGFSMILKRIRYTRKGSIREAYPCEGVEECGEEKDSYGLLQECFSPLTGCIPSEEEWKALCDKGQILSLPGGVLHYEEKGKTTELRHLAVTKNRRGCGYGRALVGAYLNRCGTALSRVWTGEENITARRLYESFGYEKDGWISRVYYFDKDEEL